ncbi:MAG: acyltransferase [Sphingomicrobium sp.]
MQNPFDPGYYGSEELRAFGFKSVGENVSIARNCTIIGLHNIEIGSNVRIDGYTAIIASRANCILGSHIHIGGGCHLVAAADLELADFSGLSQGVRIYTASDDYTGRHLTNPTVPPEYTGVKAAPIRLGRHVIVGSGSVILPGASIGDGSSVGALSLVTKPLDEWGVYSGTPARCLKARSRALLAHEAALLGKDKAHAA